VKLTRNQQIADRKIDGAGAACVHRIPHPTSVTLLRAELAGL
jgi:hypothetical protein